MIRLLLLCALFAACSSTQAVTSPTYAPVTGFAPFPLAPLERPRPPETPQSATPAPSQLRTATPAPIVRPGPLVHPAARITGISTWYDYHPGQAAATRSLRNFLGIFWRGTVVRVAGPVGSLYIRLTDYESSAIPGRLIDLDSSDFRRICGPLSTGVCSVQVVK